MNIYDFKVKDSFGEEVSMSDYKGKILVIVNTTTNCGFAPTVKPEKMSVKIKNLIDKIN